MAAPPQQRQRPRLSPAANIVDGWRSALRHNAQQPHNLAPTASSSETRPASPSRPAFPPPPHLQQHQQPAYGYARTPQGQPRTGGPSSRASSNPSHLSLPALDPPTSPTTTVDSSYPPHYHAHTNQSQRGPHHQQQRHSQPHPHYAAPSSSSAAPPSRSHHSLPAAHVHPQGRHHAQLNRTYDKPRYDAEFDRSLGGNTPAAAAAAAGRELCNPHAPATAHAHSLSSSTAVPSASASPAPPIPHSHGHGHGHGHASPSSRPRERERPSRSKRDPIDPSDLGRRALPPHAQGRDSKESLESVETDFSGRTKSSSVGGGRKSRRRRDGDEGEDGAEGGKERRMLFDPRKDDPMRFAGLGGAGASTASLPLKSAGKRGGADHADTRSLASFASADAAGAGADDKADTASLITMNTAASAPSGARKEPHPAVAQLKRAYREITDLEARLQEEARAAQREREREGREGEAREEVRLAGAERRGGDEYWVRVAQGHKQLADAHYSFLQLALDPRLPASLHQLPQRYNIPQRLWQVAFHSLLERMRHAVLSSPVPSSSLGGGAEDALSAPSLLEHLIDFIQFAYGHYSQLFEDPTVAAFRAAWIEQLGDLARYRMAVAGLAARVHAASASAAASSSTAQGLTAAALDAAAKDEDKPRRADAPSIGLAALGDWDLEEQETWRESAREWYALGVGENPGTGRLQHHLALLSKGDEVRGVYHYVKSLTATHPYPAARESILPLFEAEAQARRTQPDVTKSELFVHLHGMLFTKISLDDFSDVLERFLERLKEEGWALGKDRDGDDVRARIGHGAHGPFGDREWFMLGVSNIAALLQYGAEDGVLRRLMSRDGEGGAGAGAGEGKSSRHGHGHGHHHASKPHGAARHGHAHRSASTPTPQAIMVRSSAEVDSPGTADDTEPAASTAADDLVKQLQPSSSPTDDPLPFKLAQRLAFDLLEFVLAVPSPFRRVPLADGSDPAVILNPYLTLVLTFLSHLASHPAAFAHVERAVPWDALARLFNLLGHEGEGGAAAARTEVRLDAPPKLVAGKPLPEDWCLRGMDWAGRQLFGRGYWREHRPPVSRAGGGGGGLTPPLDGLPPPIEGTEGAALRVESEADALRFDLAAFDAAHLEGEGDGAAASAAATQLAEGRWRRLAVCAAWLVRHVPGFDYDASRPAGERFEVSGPLRAKVERWRREDEDEREAERVKGLSLGPRVDEEVVEEDEEEESEDEDDEADSEAVRELKARRRALRAVLRQARQATSAPASNGRRAGLAAKLGAAAAAIPRVFAGYTVLVFDTNILLTSLKLFRELVEAECWTIVVPLAVITELDGLSRNATALGIAAVEVISYLEHAVRAHARHLKIQTSRGNYLKDLAIRNESIDFQSSASSSSPFSTGGGDDARTMDDIILRAVTWQSTHFTSRLALVNPRAAAALPKGKVAPAHETAKVVLVTFDRNLRLKARARGLDAADEKALKKALGKALEKEAHLAGASGG
ncbi:hypothetical protein JCM10207_001737 [Rhodosporidiobolus poonsookiae]